MKANSRQSLESDLTRLEAEFKTLLVAALEGCASGAWGLFGQNDHVAIGNPHLKELYASTAASELTELAEEIERLRVLLGFAEPFALAERFDHYCALRGANVPGEPKLAKQFLAEIA